jgi:hypothetical protein
MPSNKINEATIKEVIRDLENSGKGLWLKINYEVQDDFSFLLIMIEVPRYTDEDIIQRICDLLRSTIGSKVPPKEHGYSWMGNIYIDGKLVESVVSGA